MLPGDGPPVLPMMPQMVYVEQLVGTKLLDLLSRWKTGQRGDNKQDKKEKLLK